MHTKSTVYCVNWASQLVSKISEPQLPHLVNLTNKNPKKELSEPKTIGLMFSNAIIIG